jgi:dihydrofolate reductase
MEGSEGTADWVEAWSEDYGLTSQVDACVLGAGMFPATSATGPRSRMSRTSRSGAGVVRRRTEIDWARFAARTPHYVLSSTLSSALWPKMTFVRTLDEIAALKRRPGKDIYLIGGARTTASLIDAFVAFGTARPKRVQVTSHRAEAPVGAAD